MTSKIFIPRDRLTAALQKLAEKIDLWIPAASSKEKPGAEFQRYRTGMVPWLHAQTSLPPKKVLLPQVETLLRFELHKDSEDPSRTRIQLQDPDDPSPVLVFGARPCDVRGFLTFDRVFLQGPYLDPYYRKRRERTLFATLVCREADSVCFCSSVGSGPADMEGSDFRVIALAEGLVVELLGEPVSDTHGALLDTIELAGLGSPPTATQETAARQMIEEAMAQRVGDLHTEGSAQAFVARFQDNDFWMRMASQCLGCGVCTFVCPTCYCFNITDEMKDLRGERLRSWDSCMFYNYTSEASGHNPRPTKLERYRNRVGHKFSTIPEKYDGMIGCCGCGRCIRLCPVAMDIRSVVRHLKEETCECS